MMARGRHGALERRILDLLWDRGESTVREVMDRLDRVHAYTTVMTVLDRLDRKGALAREKDGVAWRYRPVASREEVLGEKMAALFAEGKPEALLLSFLDRAEQVDPQVLDRLDALIKKHRGRRS